MIKFILMDIGGTTSSLSFVRKKVIPYALKQMLTFIKQNKEKPEVQNILSSLSAEQGCGLSLTAASELFIEWVNEGKSHHLLNLIIELIYKDGLESGDFKAHIFSEVPTKLKEWKDAGLSLAVYSSAPVEVQKALFKYSELGDLTSYLSAYFDPSIGSKTAEQSYTEISQKLGVKPEEVLFLSDIGQELDAASKAGMDVFLLLREGVSVQSPHQSSDCFNSIVVN